MPSANTHPSNGKLTLLVAEDGQDLATRLQYKLEAAGYKVSTCRNGDQAELSLRETIPDLLIIDWMMPEISGVELVRRLRRRPETAGLPVIMISARGEEQDKVRGLAAGADDYFVKPFSVNELVARVNALLRRRAPAKLAKVLKVGDTELNREAISVLRCGKPVHLGPTDYRLLQFLMEAPGRVHTRAEILDALWGAGTEIDDRTIDMHIGRVRKALLEADRADPLTTVRGVGYRFDAK